MARSLGTGVDTSVRTRAHRQNGHGLPFGFVSKAQWRYFFAKGKIDPKMAALAHKEAHKTPPAPKVRFDRLPPRLHPPGPRSLR